jgi:DNA topoisomerase-6 subunit A
MRGSGGWAGTTVIDPLTVVETARGPPGRRKGGYSVPSIVEPEYIEIQRCTADFILLVEKGTQWNRLSEDTFWRRYNCVLLTGNGQPPPGIRCLARRLHEEYKISVYVLVDNDPWGYYIYSVVKQGSINLAFESERMAIPKAKFVGLSSTDPDQYGLLRNVGIKLNDKDVSRAPGRRERFRLTGLNVADGRVSPAVRRHGPSAPR